MLCRMIAAALLVVMAMNANAIQAFADDMTVVEPVVEEAALQEGGDSVVATAAPTPSDQANADGNDEATNTTEAVQDSASPDADVQVQSDEVEAQAADPAKDDGGIAALNEDLAASGALVTQGNASTLAPQAMPSLTLVGRAQIQRRGWMGVQKGSSISVGTTGKSLRLETLELSLDKPGVSGSIVYQAHVQRKGWMPECRDGQMAGTVGKSLRLEALKIRLTDDLASAYDVWYRVHVSGIGWLAWTCNGEAAGTEGFSKRVESVDVAIVAKGQGCPAGTADADLPFVKGRDIYRTGVQEVSGDVKLDVMLDAFVKQKCGTNGEKSLRKAYQIISRYPYRVENVEPKGSWQKWSVPFAKDMYSNRSGNCYRYASLMCWVARRLGYDAKTVAGYVYTSSHVPEPHGWCEVNVNGKAYVIDPDMMHFHGERNWYMVTYAKAPIEYLRHK